MSFVKGIRSLFSFLTTLPFGGGDIESAASVFYIAPLVGLFEGVVVGALLSAMKILGLSIEAISILYIVIHIAITGGIHIDGYADYLDAIGSHRRGEEAIKIMKDPRKGSFSIAMLIVSMMMSYVSMKKLALLEMPILIPILISIYTSSAESMYIIAAIGGEEPYKGLGHMFSRYAKYPRNILVNAVLYIAILLSILIIDIGLLPQIMIVIAIAIASCLLSYRDSKYRIGFVTGDIMGFNYELTRLLCLLILSIT